MSPFVNGQHSCPLWRPRAERRVENAAFASLWERPAGLFRQLLDRDQAAKTLTHEACHVVAGHSLGMNSRDVETVAESAAFVVLNHYGFDSSGYTFPYVAGWAQDRAILKRNLGAVQQTAHRIIVDLEGENG